MRQDQPTRRIRYQRFLANGAARGTASGLAQVARAAVSRSERRGMGAPLTEPAR